LRIRSPSAHERDAAKASLLAYMADAMEERRKAPRDDFISKVLTARIGDRAISDWEAENLLATLLSGGLDSVASALSFAMHYMATAPDARQALIDDPALIPRAADELIRRFAGSNTARLITRDELYHGAPLRAGEQILVPTPLFALDPEVFDRPLEVDFERGASMAGFGHGPHRCPGANLARLEMRLLLKHWLHRIPHFNLNPDKTLEFATGMGNTVVSLPLKWTSGDKDHRDGTDNHAQV
jgi:cytochrome P450